MANFIIGLLLGIPVCLGGRQFLIFIRKALAERREDGVRKAKEAMEIMVDKVVEKIQKK